MPKATKQRKEKFNVMLDPPIRTALEAYARKANRESVADAMRSILREKLKGEGLLK